MTGRSKKGELYAAGYQHITLAVTPRFHQNTKTKSQKKPKVFRRIRRGRERESGEKAIISRSLPRSLDRPPKRLNTHSRAATEERGGLFFTVLS